MNIEYPCLNLGLLEDNYQSLKQAYSYLCDKLTERPEVTIGTPGD